jgi:N-acetylglucosaminyldiphosphoundecaprenol N-acetyl-beta-D-mannosaminyltransferase
MFNFTDKLELEKILNEKIANVTFLNHYSYKLARKNVGTFLKMDYIFIDGAMLSLFNSIFVKKIRKSSFDMSSLAPVVLNHAVNNDMTICFVGTTKENINKFIKHISLAYPKLRIILHRDGYFTNQNDKKTFQKKVKELNPDIIVAGMGTPLQENFLIDMTSIGWKGLGFTCGGFFHQTAMRGVEYYPKFIVKYELRWLYRILRENGVLRRYTYDFMTFIPLFIFDVLISRTKSRV